MPGTEDAFDMARACLNDQDKAIYTNARLLAHLNMAYRRLHQKLALNGVPVIMEVTAAPVNVLTGADTVASPVDMLSPIRLWDRVKSGSDDDWRSITEKYNLRPTEAAEPQEYIKFWQWYEGSIIIIPPTQDREVKIDYIKFPAALTDPTASIGIVDCLDFLGYATASRAAALIGKNMELASVLKGESNESMEILLGNAARKKQATPVRRRPFRPFGTRLI